jgi:hypothetical protein
MGSDGIRYSAPARAWIPQALVFGFAALTCAVIAASGGRPALADVAPPVPVGCPFVSPTGPVGAVSGPLPASVLARFGVLRRPQRGSDQTTAHLLLLRYWPGYERLLASEGPLRFYLVPGNTPEPVPACTPAQVGNALALEGVLRICIVEVAGTQPRYTGCSTLTDIERGHGLAFTVAGEPDARLVGLVPERVAKVIVRYRSQTVSARVRENFVLAPALPAVRRGPQVVLPKSPADMAHNERALEQYSRATTPLSITWRGPSGQVVRTFH